MEVNVRDFLKKFTVKDLVSRGVLQPDRRFEYLLRAQSVEPLRHLMREHNVTRLVAEERNWFIKDNGDFNNPGSEEIRSGNVSQLKNRGMVFNNYNPFINPFFKSGGMGSSGVQEDSPSPSFTLEGCLQRALRDNIEQLDPGLTIIDGGSERTVGAGRIDITAEDSNGNLVVIELKAGTAEPDSIAQLLRYMGTIENPYEKPIRGILLANDFHPKLSMAARAVSNVSLKAYSFRFTFEDRL